MNGEMLGAALVGGSDPGRVVELFTGAAAPEAAPWPWWPALIVVGLAALAAVAAIGVWRVRTSGLDGAERAFRTLARHRGLDRGARDLVRRAAASHGCPPVALLVSGEAMVSAMTRVAGSGGEGA